MARVPVPPEHMDWFSSWMRSIPNRLVLDALWDDVRDPLEQCGKDIANPALVGSFS